MTVEVAKKGDRFKNADLPLNHHAWTIPNGGAAWTAEAAQGAGYSRGELVRVGAQGRTAGCSVTRITAALREEAAWNEGVVGTGGESLG